MAIEKQHTQSSSTAVTAVAESFKERSHSKNTYRAMRHELRPRYSEGAMRRSLRALMNRITDNMSSDIVAQAARSICCNSSLRFRSRYQFYVLAAATVVTWSGVAGKVVGHSVEAAAMSLQETERRAAAVPESSNEHLLLADLLPALRYRALLSPWIWFICLCSFFLLHAFCKQLLLLLRQQRGQGINRFALLLQSKIFPTHGINRLMSAVHALVALNWGALVLLEKYTTSDPAVSGAAGTASAVDGVHLPGTSPNSHKVSAGIPGTPAGICLWDFGESVTPQERALLLFSLSYFIYDTWYEGFYGNICDCLHHAAAILGLLNVLGSDVGARDLIAALVVGEVSTPLLHLRYCGIQFVKNIAAMTTLRDAAPYTTLSPARNLQEQQPHSLRQGNQKQNDNQDGHIHSRVNDGDTEAGEVFSGMSPASTASTAVSNCSPSGSTTSRSTPGSAALAASAGLEISCDTHGSRGVPSQDLPVKSAGTYRKDGIHSTQNLASSAAATGAGSAAENPVGEGAEGLLSRGTPQGAAKPGTSSLSAGVELLSATPLEGNSSPAGTTPPTGTAGSSNASGASLAFLGHGPQDTPGGNNTEVHSRQRIRAETYVRSGPNVHIPTSDPAATTGAAAILAAALGTAVAAAALGASATAAAATTAAIVAASCSFIIFSLVLRLSQRGSDANSMFATSFHIPAGYVFPPSPRSESPASQNATGETALRDRGAAPAATAAVLAREQEVAAVMDFLGDCRHKIQSKLDGIEKCFFIVFVLGRAVLAPCVVYACVTCPSTPILVRTSGMLILIVSCYWLSLLFKHVRNRERRRKEAEGKRTFSCTEKITT